MDILEKLNDRQKEAVLTTEGPLLILAGAGSGKTRTIIHRIAYLIQQGLARPWEILAITFTNKAAGEMRERIAAMDIVGSGQIWIHTFHAMCARMMRQHGELLGYDRHFIIYDTDDQKRLYKQIAKDLGLDDKQFSFGSVAGRVSAAKDRFLSPSDFKAQLDEYDYRGQRIAEYYALYQKQLKANNVMDFDDLIFNTVTLLKTHPNVLAQYQHHFKYVLVDEYQDTNHAQYLLVEMLSGLSRNLCVCGDDDQSIYGWRGADITNILDFEKAFPDAKVVKLEQNYRSTNVILGAANGVIANNKARKAKKLWTANPGDEKILLSEYETGYEEAAEIAGKIRTLVSQGATYGDCAVLYRTNAQSRLFEEAFMRTGIPYQLVGSTGFYARQEIKDIMTYLHVLVNPKDDLGCARIINMPKRGIGPTTMEKLREYADFKEISLMEAVAQCRDIPTLSEGAAAKIAAFADVMLHLTSAVRTDGIADLLRRVIRDSGYEAMLAEGKMDNSESRLENLQELVSSAAEFEKTSDDPDVTAFLETVALSSDTDQMEDDQGKVMLMTLHCAKGLEFSRVFMPGMEQGTFPTQSALRGDRTDGMEEERRICYVGITRAKKKLYLSRARVRTLFGNTEYRMPSDFLAEVPREYLEIEEAAPAYPRRKTEVPQRQRESHSGIGRNRYIQTYAGMRAVERSAAASGIKTNTVSESAAGYGALYRGGDKVRHPKFGIGTVVQVENDKLTIAFPGIGIKKLKTSFVDKV